jgi:hypothetical protein
MVLSTYHYFVDKLYKTYTDVTKILDVFHHVRSNNQPRIRGWLCLCFQWKGKMGEFTPLVPVGSASLNPRKMCRQYGFDSVCGKKVSNVVIGYWRDCRSQWAPGLRRGSAAALLLGLWVRIPPVAWMFVCCKCWVLSGRGLCVGLITSPEESYWVWCV